MNRIITALGFFMLFICAQTDAQKTILQGQPSLADRFPKKTGNLLFSDLTITINHLFDNETGIDTIRFYNNSNSSFSLAVSGLPSHLEVGLNNPVVKPHSEGFIKIRYDAAKRKDYGFVVDGFTLETSDTLASGVSITVVAVIDPRIVTLTAEDSVNAPRLVMADSAFDYKTIHQGEYVEKSIKISNKGKKDLQILAVKTTCGCINGRAEKMTLAAGESSLIYATINTKGKHGNFGYGLTIYSNDPFEGKKQMEVKGEVIP